MRGLAAGTEEVRRVNNYETEDTDEEIQILEKELRVMKLRKQGKYSGRKGGGSKWRNCDLTHSNEEECSAKGKVCFTCGEEDHYSRAPACTEWRKKAGEEVKKRLRRVEEKSKSDSKEEESSEGEEVRRVKASWPGTKRHAKPTSLRLVQVSTTRGRNKSSRWVTVQLGGKRCRLFADTGSCYTIISPDMYKRSMGNVVAANCTLRAWGSKTSLDAKGMIMTHISTLKGAKTRSWVYNGHNPEPLLGDKDAEALGIVVFCPEGRDPLPEEVEQGEPDSHVVKKMKERSLPEKFRAVGFKVDTGKRKVEIIKHEEKEAVMSIVRKYYNTVFQPGIGCVKTEPIQFKFEDGFCPVQPGAEWQL
jgi:hypothetical protein